MPIFVLDVVPGMIDSIIFGYNYDKAHMSEIWQTFHEWTRL